MTDILKEGIWDNIITGVKKAQKGAGAKLGNAQSAGALTLLKTTELLHHGFELWCGKNSKKTNDSDALYEYLTDHNVVGYSEEFAKKWAELFDQYLSDPKTFLSSYSTTKNIPKNKPIENEPISSNIDTQDEEDDSTKEQVAHTEKVYGELLQNHLESIVYKKYKQYKPSQFTNAQDGLFIFVSKQNLNIMKQIRAEINSNTLNKKEKYNEYVSRGVMKTWKEIARIIKVPPTEENAKLAIANSLSTGIPRNYFKDIKRFSMSFIKDAHLPFIIKESTERQGILLTEAMSSKMRQFFELIAIDGNKTGASRQAVHSSRQRSYSNRSDVSDHIDTPKQKSPSIVSISPIASFTRDDIDIIKEVENHVNGGLVGIATINNTATIRNKAEVKEIIKKIVSAGMADLKKKYPHIIS
jgi:hypothetical protein